MTPAFFPAKRACGAVSATSCGESLSAFWGAVAVAILIMAIVVPLITPHDPLKANFRRMSKPPDAQILRHRPDWP